MRLSSQPIWMQLRPLWAGLMAGLVLLLTLASADARLHGQFHADAAHEHGPCAICSIAQGHIDAPVATIAEIFAPLSFAWTLPTVAIVAPAAVEISTAPSRGPPVSVSSQS